MGFIKEFKEFAMRGNVIDLAIGVVIGAAFQKIVTALVTSIITPLIGVLLNGKNFNDLAIKVGDAEVKYGLFIQAVIDFVLVAFVIFLFIKAINRFRKKEEAVTPPTKQEELLIEIRDLLKNQRPGGSV